MLNEFFKSKYFKIGGLIFYPFFLINCGVGIYYKEGFYKSISIFMFVLMVICFRNFYNYHIRKY